MFWHTYKFINSWNSSKWNEFEQRHFELSQKCFIARIVLINGFKDHHVSQDTVCQTDKFSPNGVISARFTTRTISEISFKHVSELADFSRTSCVLMLSFVSKSYPSSLIKSQNALLYLVLTQNCVFRWGNKKNPAVRETSDEDILNFLIEERILCSLIQDMGLVWRKEIRN